jgi:hypothetical protein
MASLVLAGNTSGSITISSPAVSGSNTLTLPASTGTVILSDASANLQFNSGYGSVATAYGCRAWVNFNGTGTPAIRASGNLSSITDNGIGDYTLNFTNAMPDANYSAGGSVNMTTNPASGEVDDGVCYGPVVYATTSLRGVVARTNAPQDAVNVNVQIFR